MFKTSYITQNFCFIDKVKVGNAIADNFER